jgi:uncharacterized membrane protein YphA (DoxX/SURF4 family)
MSTLETPTTLKGTDARLALIALLVVQIGIGYEWFMSGLTKIYRGTFVPGLAADLREKSPGAEGWYRGILNHQVIPNAHVFGYLIEWGELVVGVGFIAAAAWWLYRGERASRGIRIAIYSTTIVAALAGTIMAVNFHIANGSPHAWLIPKDGFDESVDLDSLLPFIQLLLIGVSARLLWLERTPRTQRTEETAPAQALPLDADHQSA